MAVGRRFLPRKTRLFFAERRGHTRNLLHALLMYPNYALSGESPLFYFPTSFEVSQLSAANARPLPARLKICPDTTWLPAEPTFPILYGDILIVNCKIFFIFQFFCVFFLTFTLLSVN